MCETGRVQGGNASRVFWFPGVEIEGVPGVADQQVQGIRELQGLL